MSPTYAYECQYCKFGLEQIKSIAQSDEKVDCPKCRLQMLKVIQATQLSPKIKPFEPHFNYGLGKVVTSHRDINEHIRRVKGEKGKEIVEVGNDKLESVKVKRKAYTLD